MHALFAKNKVRFARAEELCFVVTAAVAADQKEVGLRK